jgi:predicted transcriptional regulator
MKPTESELAILKVLWENEPCTVRLVNDKLNESRKTEKEIGYTTTLKLMQIMTEKGILKRTIEGRRHIYESVTEQSETQSFLVEDLVESAFGGSAMRLVMQALGNHDTSQEELEKIKALIKSKETKND